MFASKVQKDVTVGEGEAAVIVTIRKLSGRSLEKASEARQIGVAQGMKSMGGDILRTLRDLEEADKKSGAESPEKPDYAAATKKRYATYDRATVLVMGVVRWTAEPKVGAQALDDLEEDAAQKIHEAILDLSLPPLDPAEFKAAQGKDSGLSSSS
jgi:hypothetical protein